MPLDPAIGSAMVVFIILAKSFLRWICIVVPYFLRNCTQRRISFQHVRGVVLVFWFWQEIVFGVTYVLSVQYSCAVVLVFWLWREIDLKMRTCFHKKILLGYFIMIC